MQTNYNAKYNHYHAHVEVPHSHKTVDRVVPRMDVLRAVARKDVDLVVPHKDMDQGQGVVPHKDADLEEEHKLKVVDTQMAEAAVDNHHNRPVDDREVGQKTDRPPPARVRMPGKSFPCSLKHNDKKINSFR